MNSQASPNRIGLGNSTCHYVEANQRGVACGVGVHACSATDNEHLSSTACEYRARAQIQEFGVWCILESH